LGNDSSSNHIRQMKIGIVESMNHQEGQLDIGGGQKLYYQTWLPVEPPKAVLQIVHGYAEHGGRYQNVVDKLVPSGYAVYVNDLYGHGKSEGPRGFTRSYRDLIATTLKMNNLIHEKEGADIPVFMLGHSLGAMIGPFYAALHQETLDGLILSGCGVRYPDMTQAKRVLIAVLSKFSRAKVMNAPFPADRLSHDQEVVKAYENDPMVFAGKFTLGMLEAMRKMANGVSKAAKKVTLPVLILKGGDDEIISGAQELFVAFQASKDKTLKVYDGFKHEVHNETEERRKQVLEDLQDWLDAHI